VVKLEITPKPSEDERAAIEAALAEAMVDLQALEDPYAAGMNIVALDRGTLASAEVTKLLQDNRTGLSTLLANLVTVGQVTAANNDGLRQILVTYPDSVAGSFTVTAKTASGTTATDYTGTVHFTSSDGQAVLPADYIFTATDAAQAQANLDRDQRDLQRDEQLFNQGYLSQQQYQAQQAAVRNDQGALQAATSNLRSAQATVQANGSSITAPGLQSSSVAQSRAQVDVALAQAEQIRVQIPKARIVSPIDGVVVNRNINPCEYP